MAESIMLEKAKDFAVNIVNLCKYIKETKRESVLTNQLLRAGTSIGANIHESKYAPRDCRLYCQNADRFEGMLRIRVLA